jgi:Peptidase_C39 like family
MGTSVSSSTSVSSTQPQTSGTDVIGQITSLDRPTRTSKPNKSFKPRTTTGTGASMLGSTGGTLVAGGRRTTPTTTTPQRSTPTNAGNVPNIVNTGLSDQTSPGASDDYRWAPGFGIGPVRVGQQNGKISEIGCTLTAFTNGLNAAHPNANLSLRDANNLSQSFKDTLNNTTFTDLSGQNKRVYARDGQGPKIEQMNPVTISSPAGQTMVNSIRQSVKNGKPVLVGFRNSDGSQIRHSATAVGYNNGQVQVMDSITGKVVPMNQFLQTYGYGKAQFDYAYSMSPK